MKKVWIFDFDGTLADTLEPFFQAFNQACLSLGFEQQSLDMFLDLFEGNIFEGLRALGLDKRREAEFMERLKGFLGSLEERAALFAQPFPPCNGAGSFAVKWW